MLRYYCPRNNRSVAILAVRFSGEMLEIRENGAIWPENFTGSGRFGILGTSARTLTHLAPMTNRLELVGVWTRTRLQTPGLAARFLSNYGFRIRIC